MQSNSRVAVDKISHKFVTKQKNMEEFINRKFIRWGPIPFAYWLSLCLLACICTAYDKYLLYMFTRDIPFDDFSILCLLKLNYMGFVYPVLGK